MKWGFIGTGRIAERVMAAFALMEGSSVTAAYTRDAQKLAAFCDKWKIPKRHDSITALAEDPEVEILYLATPHIAHLEHFREAVKAGKPILCEKPMGMSADETAEMVALARQHDIFLMEGLWTRFFPLYTWLDELIASGRLGKAYNVMADFSYHSPYDPGQRFFRKDLGGGAMRGAGIYPLALATAVFKEMPCEIKAMAELKNGVDLRSAALLRFPGGEMAQLLSGFEGESVQGANIAFEKGSVWIPDFWHPERAVLRQQGREEVIERPFDFPGFQFEFEEVERCVRAGKKQSGRMPLQESIDLAAALDEIYQDFGNSTTENERRRV